MIRFIMISLLFTSSLFSQVDLTTFDGRQFAVQKLKEVVLKEEEVSKAYEQYILDNYDIPSDDDLFGVVGSLLGSTLLNGITDEGIFKNISLSTTNISSLVYSLLSDDSYLKSLYESNTFRKRTFFADDEISFIVEDDFAKQLLYLITNQTSGISGIPNCPIYPLPISSKYCKKNNHIYIYDDLDNLDDLINAKPLMYYHKSRFKKGPIIITSDEALHSNIEFTFIPRGALLYDENGTKYVKTLNSIELLR